MLSISKFASRDQKFVFVLFLCWPRKASKRNMCCACRNQIISLQLPTYWTLEYFSLVVWRKCLPFLMSHNTKTYWTGFPRFWHISSVIYDRSKHCVRGVCSTRLLLMHIRPHKFPQSPVSVAEKSGLCSSPFEIVQTIYSWKFGKAISIAEAFISWQESRWIVRRNGKFSKIKRSIELLLLFSLPCAFQLAV